MKDSLIIRIFGHIKTISVHKKYVLYYCFKARLFWQGIVHDFSKFSVEEFLLGVKYYTGKYSPNSVQKTIEGYSSSWLHHKSRNKHHFEFWLDYSDRDYVEKGEKISAIEMPPKYLVEMFCDRIAASKVYNGNQYKNSDPYDYYKMREDRMIIHDNTKKELEKMLKYLAMCGEDKSFEYARGLLKLNKNR